MKNSVATWHPATTEAQQQICQPFPEGVVEVVGATGLTPMNGVHRHSPVRFLLFHSQKPSRSDLEALTHHSRRTDAATASADV